MERPITSELLFRLALTATQSLRILLSHPEDINPEQPGSNPDWLTGYQAAMTALLGIMHNQPATHWQTIIDQHMPRTEPHQDTNGAQTCANTETSTTHGTTSTTTTANDHETHSYSTTPQ